MLHSSLDWDSGRALPRLTGAAHPEVKTECLHEPDPWFYQLWFPFYGFFLMQSIVFHIGCLNLWHRLKRLRLSSHLCRHVNHLNGKARVCWLLPFYWHANFLIRSAWVLCGFPLSSFLSVYNFAWNFSSSSVELWYIMWKQSKRLNFTYFLK